jgi:hypothetical protein
MSIFLENLKLVKRFLGGDDVGYELDDFLSVDQSDVNSKELQHFLNSVMDRYPSSEGHFANEEGMNLIRQKVADLEKN